MDVNDKVYAKTKLNGIFEENWWPQGCVWWQHWCSEGCVVAPLVALKLCCGGNTGAPKAVL